MWRIIFRYLLFIFVVLPSLSLARAYGTGEYTVIHDIITKEMHIKATFNVEGET